METSVRIKFIVGTIMELLLVGIVVVLVSLGNRTLSPGYVIYVDFNRVENLKEGAEVRISGQRIGRVLAIRSRIGANEPTAKARLRTHLWIEKNQGKFVRRNSVLYINARGVIGERYIEVGPYTGDPWPVLCAGEVLRGIDAPIMDRLIQHSFLNLRLMLDLRRTLSPELRELFQIADSLRNHLKQTLTEDKAIQLASALEENRSQLQKLWEELSQGTDGGKLLKRLADPLSAISDRRDQFETISNRLGAFSAQLEELQALFNPDRRERLEKALTQLRTSADQGSRIFDELRALVTYVQSGRGTVGRLFTDPEMNDDLKENSRLLKEGPWRVLAKPPRDQAPRGRAPRRGE